MNQQYEPNEEQKLNYLSKRFALRKAKDCFAGALRPFASSFVPEQCGINSLPVRLLNPVHNHQNVPVTPKDTVGGEFCSETRLYPLLSMKQAIVCGTGL
jgi:hypothetical protein